jgi:hypothetical protein
MTTPAPEAASSTALQHPSAPVLITQAPPGVPVTVLGRLATHDLDTVVLVLTPNRGGKQAVATDVLEALGKSPDVTGKSRNATSQAEMVSVWLTAHRTRLLIVAGCQRTPVRDLLDLVEMTQATPTTVLFACDDGFIDTLDGGLSPADPVRVPWPDLPTEHPGPHIEEANLSTWSKQEPTLPAVEYWTFYATAKRQLDPETFAPVHDLYRETMQRLTDWLQDLQTAGEALTVDLAHGSLKSLIEEQTTFDRVTVVTRAAQAAYHQAGWFLDIDERELRNGLIRFPPSKTTPDLYDRLRAYIEPTRAATVALYLAGATPEAIRNTTVDDLTQWHLNPEHHVAGQPVPKEAAVFLRAALYARALDATSPDGQAFPGEKRRVSLDIRQAATDLDLNIGDANLHETSTVGTRRIPSTIVTLEHIA